jgi:catalase
MVELFTKCDAEYGRRVRESLQNAAKNPSAATSRYMGRRRTTAGGKEAEAVQQAEEMAHDAKPY